MRLDTTIFEGWRSLPDELKLHVLHYTVYQYGFFSGWHFKNQLVDPPRLQNHLGRTVYPLMSVPELKPLVVEAFYASNTMLVHFSPVANIPPRALRPYVRQLHFESGATAAAFDLLVRFGNGTLGFSRMKRIHLVFNGDLPRPLPSSYQLHACFGLHPITTSCL